MRYASDPDAITLILPTYNRASALQANLATMLAMRGITEVIVVNDGSSDSTAEVCNQFTDSRLQIIHHETNRGVAAARNSGLAAARSGWALFGEDDCQFPEDYATILLAEAHRHRADLVGAPLLYLKDPDEDVAVVAARAPRVQRPSMEDVAVFPVRPIETPFVPARALIRRPVFERLSFYDGYLVNSYREETDFFVQAARSGFRCLFSGATYCYQVDYWGGGAHQSSTLRYEYWALRNNWLFLQRHGAWLAEQGYISGNLRAQTRFFRERFELFVSGATRARLKRLAATLKPRD